MDSKVCTKCNIEKTIDEYSKNGKKKNGDIIYHSYCKACKKQYRKQRYQDKGRQRYQDNKEEIKQRYQDNKEEICAKERQRYQDKGKQRYQDNKEEICAKERQRYQDNKEEINAKQRQRYQENKDKLKCIQHGIFQDYCYQCSTKRHLFCSTCEIMLLSPNRKKQKVKVCAGCESHDQKMLRFETKWKEKFISWGYSPSVNDKIIRDYQCNVVNLRRCDFLYITEPDFPYNVLVECDENNHNIYTVLCEMRSLQEKADQITTNQRVVKPLVVIRFNPNHKDDEFLERELKAAFYEVFNNPSSVDISDARGINIYKLIGYSDKRQEKYENEPAAQTITELDAFAHTAP